MDRCRIRPETPPPRCRRSDAATATSPREPGCRRRGLQTGPGQAAEDRRFGRGAGWRPSARRRGQRQRGASRCGGWIDARASPDRQVGIDAAQVGEALAGAGGCSPGSADCRRKSARPRPSLRILLRSSRGGCVQMRSRVRGRAARSSRSRSDESQRRQAALARARRPGLVVRDRPGAAPRAIAAASGVRGSTVSRYSETCSGASASSASRSALSSASDCSRQADHEVEREVPKNHARAAATAATMSSG